MNTILDLGIQIILFLQGLGGWLKAPMKALSFLGTEQFFLLFAPLVLWCYDTALGLRLGLVLMLSNGLKDALKIALHSPRPYWYSPDVKAFAAETSFGIPSGHAQNAAAFWGVLADGIRRRWAWILAILIAFLIGLSRLYLAVHFPTDVLAGWVIGALLLWAVLHWEPALLRWWKKQTITGQFLAAFLASLVIILLSVLARLSLGAYVLPPEWIAQADQSYPDGPTLNPLALTGAVSNAAAFFGLIAGAIFIRLKGGFKVPGQWGQYILRYLFGVVGVVAIWFGLDVLFGMIFPNDEAFLALVCRYIRYGLVGAWMTGFAPWIFVKLRLAKSN